MGWAREAEGDDNAALGHYEAAIELDPGMSVARVNLAKLLGKAGRHHRKVLAAAEGTYRSRDHWDMTEAEALEIGNIYKRILHRRDTPRVRRALSDSWNGASAESAYLNHPLGLVVVDDFLSEDALRGLRLFCLQSTIWFANRYAYGRIGATFRHGFNCPLLLQIAGELAAAFPALIGNRRRLLQMWAFKYDAIQPTTSAHADFVAVRLSLTCTGTYGLPPGRLGLLA